MNKPTFKPIAMSCNAEQFESVREILEKNNFKIVDISEWCSDHYLVNNYVGVDQRVSNVIYTVVGRGREVFERWNKDLFLRYCGIQSLPEKWVVKTCVEVGAWLNNNSDLPAYRRADYSDGINLKYLVYPSYKDNHLFNIIPEGYTEITIEQFREITKTDKPMSQQKLTVPATDVLKIHKVACSNWKPKLVLYLARVNGDQMIAFNQKEVDEMFKAATTEQKPLLIRIFGEKVQIDYDKIKTGSVVMLKYTLQHVEGEQNVNFDNPFNVVFFNTQFIIRENKNFKQNSLYEYATFYQDGNYVVFSTHKNLDCITSVIEY